MKPISLLIAASLAANAALLAFVFVAPPASGPTSSAAADSAAKAAALAAAKKPGTTAEVDPKLWSRVGDADFATQIARLRDAGFPPSVIRAIITAQVRERFAAQRKALYTAPTDQPFWKSDQPTDPKLKAALRDLSAQQSKLLNELLGGPDPDASLMGGLYERRGYAGLSSAKVEQLSRVKRDYDEMRSDIYAGLTGGGPMLPEDRAKIALLEKEQRADFAQILTPQELENYELRTSSTAMQMRYSLSAFNPTESEFRAIYQQQRAFDEKYNVRTGPSTPDQMQQRAEAQKQLTAQIKASLGPERGAEYERASDYNFQAINRVVDRLSLPKTAAAEVWTLQKDIEQRSRALQMDRTLTPDARNAQLAALSTEATSKLTTALGPRGLEVYKQNGGSWIQNLQPRPATAPGANGLPTVITGGKSVELSVTRPGG